MGGFFFLWDRGLAWDTQRLARLGSRALDSLSHRYAARRIEEGGDGWWLGLCGGEVEPRVALAANRRRQTFIVLAGWLENYTELMSELDEPREGEESAEDADLVLTLCLRHGPAALDRLRGPLAAILWEPAVPRLTAVRDPLGEGSLCFAEGRGLLALASEEAALFHHPVVSRSPDLGWLARFCSRQPLPPGRTAFRDIRELAPGEHGQWQGTDFLRHRLPLSLPTELRRNLRIEDAVEEWRQSLAAAMPSAVRRGRRFGAMLSGGMDSTTAAALSVPAIHSSGRQVAAYCWRLVQYPEGDESAAIEAAARHIGIDIRWLLGDECYPLVNPTTWPLCPNLPQFNPFLRLNLAVYDAAHSDGCDVLINGHIGDYLYPLWAHNLADALALRNLRQAGQELRRIVRRDGAARGIRSPEIRDLIKRSLRIKIRPAPPRFLTEQAAERFGDTPPWPPELDLAPHPPQWTSLFGTISAMETKYERYFAERAGVERRHPLRHFRILSTVLQLPSFLFFDEQRSKTLTRSAMIGRLPDQICHTTGGGNLNALFLEGFFGEGERALRALLEGPGCLWPELIRRDYVTGALGEGRQSTAQQQRVLIATAGIELWRHAVELA